MTDVLPDNAANAYSVARAILQEVFPCRPHREAGCVYTYCTSEEEPQGIQEGYLGEAKHTFRQVPCMLQRVHTLLKVWQIVPGHVM